MPAHFGSFEWVLVAVLSRKSICLTLRVMFRAKKMQ